MAKDTAVVKTKEKSSKPGFFKRITRFFKDLRSELGKVVWPSKKQTYNNTIVVIVFIVIAGLFVWGLDSLFVSILNLILQKAA
ncbi:MAG: preprotein translocase, SecE subunit, bacterial [Oscillospiraceae bacterium]|jgi:preprotein translocase subunit SecE|nr:preprotein translocase, SecE subunit, bacterial [Oscillospiraceae bacterium]